MQNQINSSISYFYMDNYYLKTLIEMGYIGLGSYLFLLASFSFHAMRSIYRTREDKYVDGGTGTLQVCSGSWRIV